MKTDEPGDMPESALELPGQGLTKPYRDRAEELGASEPVTGDDFDRLVNWIQSELQVKSARVSFAEGVPPMAHFHAMLDGYEYVIAAVPTKLQVES